MTVSSIDQQKRGFFFILKTWPLWRQIMLAIGVAAVIVWLTSGVLIRQMERKYLLDNLRQQNQKASLLISSLSIDAVITEDSSLLETILTQSISQDPQIVLLEIKNEENTILAQLKKSEKPTRIPPMVFTDKIVYEDETFGNLTIAWNVDGIHDDIETHVTKIRIFLTIFILILSSTIILFIRHLVILPMIKINKQLIKIADGDYESTLTITASSELMRLSDSVNQLQKLLVQIELEIQNRYLAEVLQKEISQKLEALIQASPLAIITLDTDFNVQNWNQSAFNTFDWRSNEVLGAPLKIFSDQKKEWFKKLFNQALKGESSSNIESIAQKKDGSSIDIRFSSASVLNADQQVIGVIAIISDITNRVRAEEKIQNAYKAGMAENAISTLHNIGNAITPTVVNIRALSDKKQKQVYAKYLTNLFEVFEQKLGNHQLDEFLKTDDKGQKMLPFFKQIIEQLSLNQAEEFELLITISEQLSHITDIIVLQQKYANVQSATEHFEVIPIMNDVLKMMQPEFKKREILIIRNFDENNPLLHCDKNKLVQILINLFKNAIEAIDERLTTPLLKDFQPTITALITKKNQHIFFSISDNGIGANKAVLDHVFEFGRSTKSNGSGFGLHDCANFIRANHGEIQLLSAGNGKGVDVKFNLPQNTKKYKFS